MKLIEFHCDSAEYEQALAMRQAILRQPLGLDLFAEDLSQETHYSHFGLKDGDQLVAYVMSVPASPDTVTIRQMCVLSEYRGQGLGRELMLGIERQLLSVGILEIELAARVPVVPFYEKLGYEKSGAEFLSVTIPHQWMRKRLT